MPVCDTDGNLKPFNTIIFGDYSAQRNGNTVYVRAKDGSVQAMEMKEFQKFLTENVTRVDKTPQKDSYVKPSIGATIGGVTVGGLVGNGIVANAIKTPTIQTCMSKIKDIGNSLTDAEFKSIQDGAKEALKIAGLDKKGVTMLSAAPENTEIIKKALEREFNGNIITRFLPKSIKEILVNNTKATVASGNNAFCLFKDKKIILPTGKGMSWAVFHEMGHAMNSNLSTIGKTLQKCRPLAILTVPITLIALFKNKKPNGVKPEGAVDKTTTFVKNNAGKLTFAAFLPILIEEGMASIKGNKLASKLLSPELAKKVARGNKIAYLTYLGTAVATAVGIFTASKIRDAIVHKKTA